jgi:hypothetical protein
MTLTTNADFVQSSTFSMGRNGRSHAIYQSPKEDHEWLGQQSSTSRMPTNQLGTNYHQGTLSDCFPNAFAKWREVLADRNQRRAIGASRGPSATKRHRPPPEEISRLIRYGTVKSALYSCEYRTFTQNCQENEIKSERAREQREREIERKHV